MLPALSIAARGLETQSKTLEGAALVVALSGVHMSQAAAPQIEASPVRVRNLPVGNPMEALVTMKEAELAYRMNAAVMSTADEMLRTLLAAVSPDTRS